VLIEQNSKMSASDILTLSSDLSSGLSRTVDLSVIPSENLVYAREALLKGVPVYIGDLEKMNLARANLLGMNIQFNQDRKEVLEAYAAR